MLYFSLFPFSGLFGLIVPFLLLFVGIRIFRRIFRTGGRNFEYRQGQESDSIFPYDDFTTITSYRVGSVDGQDAKVFRLAQRLKGRITLSDIVIDLDLNIKEAEALIERMVDGVHVTMEVRDNGRVVYEFPEIIARLEEKEE